MTETVLSRRGISGLHNSLQRLFCAPQTVSRCQFSVEYSVSQAGGPWEMVSVAARGLARLRRSSVGNGENPGSVCRCPIEPSPLTLSSSLSMLRGGRSAGQRERQGQGVA